jgi:hypothetical protein
MNLKQETAVVVKATARALLWVQQDGKHPKY